MEDNLFPHLTDTLNEWGKIIEAKLRDRLNEDGSNASYKLNQSLKYELRVDGREYELGINMEEYWKWVNDGRKAGRMPPLKNIRDWILIKPVTPMRNKNGKLPTVNQLAWLIARKIGEKGTEGTNFFEDTMEALYNQMEKDVERAIQDDVDENVEKIIKYLIKIERI